MELLVNKDLIRLMSLDKTSESVGQIVRDHCLPMLRLLVCFPHRIFLELFVTS